MQTRGGITLHADALFSDVKPSDYDLLVLPGGPGVSELRKDGRIVAVLNACAVAKITGVTFADSSQEEE